MMTTSTTNTCETEQHVWTISQLQGDAWAAWNASYGAPLKDAYREVARALYFQDVHERIERMFARSDQQNVQLDALLVQARS
jgi:hypothetical protein